jgi:hypothetical protein
MTLALGVGCAAEHELELNGVSAALSSLAAGSGAPPHLPVAVGGSANESSAVYSAPAPYYVESVAFDAVSDRRISNDPVPVPVLLLTDNVASYNADLLITPTDIDNERVQHPGDWPAWRRTNGTVQILRQNTWSNVFYQQYELAPLAVDTRFYGLFEHRRDDILDTGIATTQDFRYRFYSDGTYDTCAASKVVIPNVPGIQRKNERKSGRYTVDGYRITLSNAADATSETLPFFYDPQYPTSLWLGSNPYPTPSDNLTEICRPL